MNKIIIVLCLFMLTSGMRQKATAQAEEIAQLLLNVEKLAQFKSILDDMKAGYDILSGGYNTIKDLSEGNFSIHKTFLDGLMEVSPEVRNYRKVAGIIEYQVLLVKEYKAAFNRFRADGLFRPEELAYMERVYGNLFNKSLRNLDELTMVITAGKLRMSDDERLEAIDRIFSEMEDKVSFLRHFNNDNSMLSLQREKEKAEIETIRIFQGKKS